MALPQPAARFERADFFAWEAEQPMKHDYVAGEVFAQAGARQGLPESATFRLVAVLSRIV